jgi:mitogen-activated protein kinase kinase kinase 3
MSRDRWVIARMTLGHDEDSGRQLVVEENDRHRKAMLMLRHQDRTALGFADMPSRASAMGSPTLSNATLNQSTSSMNTTQRTGGDSRHQEPGHAAEQTPPPLPSVDSDATRVPSSSPSQSSLATAPARLTRFQILRNEPLGRGSFGVVFKGFDRERGEIVAVKETKVDAQNRRAIRKALEEEFNTLAQLDHPNIVRVFALTAQGDTAHIVMEWMPGGSVHDMMRRMGYRLHEHTVRRYLVDALAGLAYLHNRNILHRDIKPGNMLVAGNGCVKLSDFGTSKMTLNKGAAATTCNAVGTPYYLSPEACNGRFSWGSDVWALACSVVEMASGEYPWAHLPPEMQQPVCLVFHIGRLDQSEGHHPNIPTQLSESLQRILRACFRQASAERPSADELMRDAYFASEGLPVDAESMDEYDAAQRMQEQPSEGDYSRDPSAAVIGDIEIFASAYTPSTSHSTTAHATLGADG